MKILVIDDTPANIESAKQTLGEHELTLVSNMKEATKKLESQEQYDVALCDLLMPSYNYNTVHLEGELLAVGWGLLLQAILWCGVKYAAVVTATNHHKHPSPAQFDRLGNSWCNKKMSGANFLINGCKVAFVNASVHGMISVADGTSQGKDWGRILRLLMGEAPETLFEH